MASQVKPLSPVGLRLQIAMAEAGESISALARAEGWNARLIQKWRSPTGTDPSYPNLVRLAARYGRPVSWFYEAIEDAA